MMTEQPLIVCLGEALCDFVADEIGSDLGAARRFTRAPGGAVANTAVGVARLGATSRFVGKVGADPFGKFLRRSMAAEGIDTRWLLESDTYPTALVFVIRDEQRSPRFVFFGSPSADMMLGPEEVGAEALAGADFFHLGTVSMVRPESRAATAKLMGLARAGKVKISFDPNLRFHLWKDHEALRRIALETVEAAAIVKLNEAELTFLTGEADVARGAARLRELGAAVVVVTRGAGGAYFQSGVGFANAVGAMVTTAVGAVEALPTRAGVEDFLRGR
jgi:fructokinase